MSVLLIKMFQLYSKQKNLESSKDMLLPRFSSKWKYLMVNVNGHLKKLDNDTILNLTNVLAYIPALLYGNKLFSNSQQKALCISNVDFVNVADMEPVGVALRFWQ